MTRQSLSMNLAALTTLTTVTILLAMALPAQGADLFSLERLEVAADVVEREPVGVSDTFPAGQQKVYALAELRDIRQDTTINFVWYRDNREVAVVPLPVERGNRWRTYSSVTLWQRSGDWRVELTDEEGNLRRQVEFRVR